jgi:hypothetical protein
MTQGAAIERRRRIAARILIGEGALLLAVAVAELATAQGPGALDHAVSGVVLLPMGLTTIIAANGVRAGSETAWRIAMINACALLLLPFILILTILLAPPLPLGSLMPAIALSLIGIAMVFALLWARPS